MEDHVDNKPASANISSHLHFGTQLLSEWGGLIPSAGMPEVDVDMDVDSHEPTQELGAVGCIMTSKKRSRFGKTSRQNRKLVRSKKLCRSPKSKSAATLQSNVLPKAKKRATHFGKGARKNCSEKRKPKQPGSLGSSSSASVQSGLLGASSTASSAPSPFMTTLAPALQNGAAAYVIPGPCITIPLLQGPSAGHESGVTSSQAQSFSYTQQ